MVKISHDELIDLLQEHYDDKIFENIKDKDRIEAIIIRSLSQDIEIIIGEEEVSNGM